MRLLCDEMLAGLARWLRAAGHDTALAARGAADGALLAQAAADGRCLLTRDASLAAADGAVLRLRSATLDGQAVELARAAGLDWQAAPFTRRLLDNTALRDALPEERARAPAGVRERGWLLSPQQRPGLPHRHPGLVPGSTARREMPSFLEAQPDRAR